MKLNLKYKAKKVPKVPGLLLSIACCLFFIIACRKDGKFQEARLNANHKQTMYRIHYGTSYRNYFDIALPAHRTTNTPVVIFIHGGAWIMGNKNYFFEDIETFANHGIAAVAINYRYASNLKDVHNPELAEDVRKALDFIVSKSEKWQVSSDRFGIIGHSAGGHLALLTTYLFNDDKKIKACASWAAITNLIDKDQLDITDAKALFKLYTGSSLKTHEDTIRYKEASPFWMATTSSVPTLLIHGTKDPGVPYSNAQRMKEKLDQLGVENQLITMDGAYHIWTGEHHQKARHETLNWFKDKL